MYRIASALACAALLCPGALASEPLPADAAPAAAGRSEPLELAWSIGGETARLSSQPWFAGAVSSLTFRGVEYLDSADHGRLLQGAIAFENALECLNPTLAGASRDRPPRTTSRLLWAHAGVHGYATSTQMAYWKRPGEDCSRGSVRRRAVNRTALSDVIYTQVLRPGYRGYANAVEHQVVFTTGTDRGSPVVEVLTAYTPPSFDTFHLYDAAHDRFLIDRQPYAQAGEQDRPVILATADGSSAIGFVDVTPETGRYGRYTFPVTNKISIVHRPRGAYRAGSHAYRCVWVIGTLAEVKATVRGIQLGGRAQPL